MTTKKITDETFETEVLKASKPTIVDFWAEWCGPCKQIGPVLEEISDELKNDVVIGKHNIDEELHGSKRDDEVEYQEEEPCVPWLATGTIDLAASAFHRPALASLADHAGVNQACDTITCRDPK